MVGTQNTVEIEISVLGPFRVVGRNGEDLTPKGRKECGLLAILALSQGRSRPRTTLQDKLWSDRGPDQAANSLRQALSQIRKSLGPYRDCLIADSRSVSLAYPLVKVDLDGVDFTSLAACSDADAQLLLEGMDIRDEEFENWLRRQRSIFDGRLASARIVWNAAPPERPAPPRGSPVSKTELPLRPWIRILPPTVVSGEAGAFYSRVISDAIARGVRELGTVDISHELRDAPGIDLQVEVLPTDTGVGVHVSLREVHSQTYLWSGTQHVPAQKEFICNIAAMQMLINQAVDVATIQLRSLMSDREDANAFVLGLDAIRRMFQGDKDNLDAADTLLSQAFDCHSSGIILAWKAYLRTFFAGEYRIDRKAQADEVRMLIRNAIQAEPYNSSVLALGSYIHSFVLGEYHTAHELAELSLKYNPGNPLGLVFLGRAKSYLGEHDAGYRIAAQARAVAGLSPYRYTIDFLCGVTAALSGRHEEAIRLQEIACSLAPNYRAPLRYLVALNLRSGDRRKARDAFDRLRQAEPDFSIGLMRERSYPSAGLRVSGLLDVVDGEFE